MYTFVASTGYLRGEVLLPACEAEKQIPFGNDKQEEQKLKMGKGKS
jgi:hypothetical protein